MVETTMADNNWIKMDAEVQKMGATIVEKMPADNQTKTVARKGTRNKF